MRCAITVLAFGLLCLRLPARRWRKAPEGRRLQNGRRCHVLRRRGTERGRTRRSARRIGELARRGRPSSVGQMPEGHSFCAARRGAGAARRWPLAAQPRRRAPGWRSGAARCVRAPRREWAGLPLAWSCPLVPCCGTMPHAARKIPQPQPRPRHWPAAGPTCARAAAATQRAPPFRRGTATRGATGARSVAHPSLSARALRRPRTCAHPEPHRACCLPTKMIFKKYQK